MTKISLVRVVNFESRQVQPPAQSLEEEDILLEGDDYEEQRPQEISPSEESEILTEKSTKDIGTTADITLTLTTGNVQSLTENPTKDIETPDDNTLTLSTT